MSQSRICPQCMASVQVEASTATCNECGWSASASQFYTLDEAQKAIVDPSIRLERLDFTSPGKHLMNMFEAMFERLEQDQREWQEWRERESERQRKHEHRQLLAISIVGTFFVIVDIVSVWLIATTMSGT